MRTRSRTASTRTSALTATDAASRGVTRGCPAAPGLTATLKVTSAPPTVTSTASADTVAPPPANSASAESHCARAGGLLTTLSNQAASAETPEVAMPSSGSAGIEPPPSPMRSTSARSGPPPSASASALTSPNTSCSTESMSSSPSDNDSEKSDEAAAPGSCSARSASDTANAPSPPVGTRRSMETPPR